jgi:hypothetical protein
MFGAKNVEGMLLKYSQLKKWNEESKWRNLDENVA